ncbi:FRG domain-containing protein [Rhodoferax ferrireducens]|uniref:FRG domain-containing protein n=1 Tax=Rhodoferax ferrireducens TaxID=192843 RepID=UPI00298E310C|nr:FRG domain-containing protein [Rhodoferax ferrireducens]WPC67508.1 FRG domain-containing protein [Rhodoferax ferrireducens]
MVERKDRVPLEPEGSIKVGSVRTFLTEMERFEPEKGYTYFFRGHSRFSHRLVPSIYRDPSWIANEEVLFKELVLRCPNDFSGQESTFQSLVKMQHYSLPTRLLDITANPLVAMYFACEQEGQTRESGEVVVFRIPTAEIKYFDSDTVSVLANISRRPSSFELPDADLDREAFNDHTQIHYLLHEVKREKPYFEPLILRAHLESVVCVKPKLDNARIIKQDGAFLLFGMNGRKTEPASVPMGFLAAAASKRLLVEPTKKAFIRKQLESLGLTQATIFPEIDKVAEFIKRTYATPALTASSESKP